MTLELAKSILAVLTWPAGCVAIAWMVTQTPLWSHLQAFLFPDSAEGDR